MRNIKINEAETIFENFWDSGESYPENYKYSCLSQYTVKAGEGISGGVEPTWMSVKVYMGTNKGKKAVISMERDCELDITGYDVFRLYASVSKNIKIRIKCCIDGIETEVINDCGCDTTKEYNGKISGNMISHIYMEFENMSEDASEGNLMWLGLSNSVKEAEMLAQKSPYDDSWEGCFSDEPEIKPQYGIYFNESELEELRKKLSQPPFSDSMELLRKEAKEAMKIIPENEIGTFVHKNFKRFIRERDDGKVVLSEEMPKLAFVGIIDNNIEMLKMACRMALSVAHCQYFCESIIGVFPGATWHHRSFTEEDICKALVKVLEWAGGLLTWHGKNIIYDAIIMKGLPRIDADIKTMDYMWKMNQGTAFVSSLVIILIALEKIYPRYSVRIDEAEKDLITMWNMYVFEDGGSAEGPQYWSFTASQMIEALYLIARYRGKSIEDYIPESIKRSSVYALAQLSDAGDFYVPVNDAHVNLNYGGNVLSFLAQINVGDIWKVKNNNSLNKKRTGTDRLIELLIFAKELDVSGDVEVPEFISLPYTGHTTLRRKTEDLGVVGLHAISGAITFGHAHSDKGSFVLEAGGKSLLIDRGVCGYDNPYVTVIGNSEMHNMIAAIKDDEYITQEKNNPELCGEVLKSEYNNGVFEYVTDVTKLWNGIFEKNIRHITSVNPYQYIIEDNIKLKDADMAVFILNTYGEITQEQDKFIITDGDIRLVVSTQNWMPCETEFGRYGTDGNGRDVSRLCLMTSSKNEEKLITAVELQK